MSLEEWALVLGVVFSGLWAGLMVMLTTVLHPMLRRMDGREFALFLRRFLPVARRAPANYACVLGMVVCPAVALIALGDDPGAPAFVLTAIGLALTVAGPLLSSRFLAEPNYDEMLAWDPAAMPVDWEAGRARYFRLNWLRAAATWAAFASLIAATVVLFD